MRRSLLATAVLVAGCTTAQVQQGIALGQLFCTAAGTFYQAGQVNVIGASGSAVAGACAVLTVAGQLVQGAAPAPLPAGVVPVVAAVPAAAVTAVNASKAS